MNITKYYSWELIKEYYDSLYESGWKNLPMLNLINFIISSRYKDRLYAFTSLDVLIISIYEEIDKFSEALHLKFETDSQVFIFKYYGGNNGSKQPEWERRYEPNVVNVKFESFIKMIKW